MIPKESDPTPSLQSRLWRELLIAARFGIVGIGATALHISVAWSLITYMATPALLANLIAFLCAFGLSFGGNYLWTFSTPGSPAKAIRRFFVISLSAFLANSALLATILASGWLSPRLAVVASAAVVPGFTFLASRLWGFRQQHHE
ncbi:GtrA family protein [Pseudomonas multiresinivorans]|uniref:GtrA family protein n=1 Tax=Pseudomonas multiresinivorans TaxID=95301 RepID=A0A7Z3GNF3_9PSED|nr:GtrA family protein [Pseudomonas multiresinivorans]QJP06768.1 GtrA family protein [Pseudomonas multiresinivorans]